AVRGRSRAGDPRRPSRRARRLTAGRLGALEARARQRRAARPRLRHARRREGDGRPGARPPAHPAARALGHEALGRPGRGRSPHPGACAEARRTPMPMRLTPLALSVVTVVAWGLVLGVLSGRAELVVVVLPLLLGLGRIGRTDAPRRWSLARALSAERVFEGARVTVTVTVTADERGPLLELLEPLPPTLRLVSGENRALVTLGPGASVEWRYEVECVRRGRAGFGTVHARLWDRAGLQAGETSVALPGHLRIYPRPLPLRRLPGP